MSFNEWKKVILKDVIEFNPKETIKKGEISKKIAMEKLDCFTRKISGYEETKFTSGTKFRNGDTLLARITPCLENGKTAQVNILDDNEVGFGSTEFIVLREKQDISSNDYIYYLSISPKFRELAIKSMTGTSGRQRVQKDVLEQSEIMLPLLEEQKAIANILSTLDEKIEVNNQINKKLEEMAQAIFKRWFVDFEFPDENGNPYKSSGGEMIESEMGMIPKGWNSMRLGETIEFVKGKKPKKISAENSFENSDVYLTIDTLNGGTVQFGLKEKVITVNEKEALMVMDGASSGTLYYGMSGILGSTLAVIRSTTLSSDILYYLLKYYESSIKQHLTGSAIPHADKSYINNLVINIPNNNSRIEKVATILANIREYSINIRKENEKLLKTRDILLPKLISGEIRIPLDK